MNKPVPNNVGRYEIVKPIGSGACGDVYKGYDPVLKRSVAIKMPSGNLQGKELKELLADFFHAAEVGAKFQHANIVSVYDMGKISAASTDETDIQSHFLVMEYVPGVNLHEYMHQNPRLTVEESLRIVFECCKALDYIHFNGISHRDMKPGNIMINAEAREVKITDFSISDTTYSELNKHMGTLPYMTPEHFLTKERLTQQTDIFALGSVMYHLLAGVCPFRGDSVGDVVKQICHSHPEPIRSFNPDVPPSVEFIVIKAMSKSPEDRFQTALEFTDAVNLALQESTSGAGSTSSASLDDISIDEYLLLRNHSWFKDFSPSDIEELLRSGDISHFDAGEYILREGEEALCFYTLLEGEADVVKDSEVINKLLTGECFGEIGYLSNNRKRTASIRALTPVRVLSVDSRSIADLSFKSQAMLYKTFLTKTLERMA